MCFGVAAVLWTIDVSNIHAIALLRRCSGILRAVRNLTGINIGCGG